MLLSPARVIQKLARNGDLERLQILHRKTAARFPEVFSVHRLCGSYARGLPAKLPLLEQSAAEPTKHLGEIWVRTGKFALMHVGWA